MRCIPARKPALAFMALAVVALHASAASAASGDLFQVAGASACVSNDTRESPSAALNTCLQGRGLDDGEDIAVSPNGKNLYVASGNSGSASLAVLNRDVATGAISQPADASSCFVPVGSALCTAARLGDSPSDPVVSSDGKFVYVGDHNG